MPQFETHQRVIRSWNPKTRKIEGTPITKIAFKSDGKTPRMALTRLVTDEETGRQVLVPLTELVPVAKPIKLLKGSAKAIYRLLKKIERTVGLDTGYAQMKAEVAA